MIQLSDKVPLVIGGAQGIGEAIVRHFFADDTKVVVAGIKVERGKALTNELGDRSCAFVQCDLGNAEHVGRLIAETLGILGGPNIAVNNACINRSSELLELAEADFDRVPRVNLKRAFLVGQAAARQMASDGERLPLAYDVPAPD